MNIAQTIWSVVGAIVVGVVVALLVTRFTKWPTERVLWFCAVLILIAILVSVVIQASMPEEPPSDTIWLDVRPSDSSPSPGQEVTLTPVPCGKAIVLPAYIVWTKDCGAGLPEGSKPFNIGDCWRWTAPDFTTDAHIEAVVSDSANLVARGSVVINVSTPSPPPPRASTE